MAVRLPVPGAAGLAFDGGELLHRHEVTLRVGLAKAARHRAVLRKRAVQLEAHHREPVGRRRPRRRQEPGEHAKRLRPIEIIRIDDRKRPVQQRRGAQNGMAGAPRFLASGRHAEPGRQHFKLLKSVIQADVPGKTAAETVPEVLLNLPADHKDKLAKTGPLRVEHGIIQHRLAGGTDRLNLLQTAITGTDAGG